MTTNEKHGEGAKVVCRGCNKPLKQENAWMCDGCPCNSERGKNHGLVSSDVCTCDKCKPSFPDLTLDDTNVGPNMKDLSQDCRRPSVADEMAWLRQEVERLSAWKIAAENPKGASGARYYAMAIEKNDAIVERIRADHDAAIAEKDATIAELQRSRKSDSVLIEQLTESANEFRQRAERAEAELEEAKKEPDGWHGVVVECERILKAVGTAEKPLTSNLPNLIRDRLQNLHRAEEANAKLAAECEGLRELLRQVRNDLHRSRAFIGKGFPHVKDEINTTMDKIDAALSAAAGRG